MKEIKLTDSEEVIMEILWEKEKVFMKEILESYPEPKPATTTVATLLKRMQNKDFVGYELFGNSREYFPKIKKSDYFKEEMTSMIDRFFNSSVTQFASFFTTNTKLSQKQLKELREIIDKEIKE
ncbi:BlaI/MecI/CopY family transcriptional regulator [Chryseobacterium sp. Hurlbut01]|jgi:predicted transcriptional regulator|uniref:BlaI/MecI/CopY family transcriptional regulator n=1 Tax=Chryseobacterium sp. Hurlbut01 TaxID=1681828 RepID=UPI00067CFE9C|nr:BlaI/MecI/CopY family transcriptional regulator [Chryseobacterium sp. Hurlbut01]KNB62077.1 penicillinase repressor [Chryseobacterium sp. Hurlbut01]